MNEPSDETRAPEPLAIDSPRSRTRDIAWWFVVLLVFFASACWLTRPLVRDMWRHVYGHNDALYTVWALNHNYRVMLSGDWRSYWRAPMLTPYKFSLVLADAHLGTALWTLPAYVASGSPVFAQNVGILGSFVLTGIGAYLVASEVTRRRFVALAVGVAALAVPYRIAQLVHLPILMSHWQVLAFWCLLRCWRDPRALYVGLFGASSLLGLVSSLYFGLYQWLLLGPTVVILGRRGGWFRRDGLLRAWLWTIMVSALLAVWFLRYYYLVYATESFDRRLIDVVSGSSQPQNLWSLSDHHLLKHVFLFGSDGTEFALFPGMLLVGGLVATLIAEARDGHWIARVAASVRAGASWLSAHRDWALGMVGASVLLSIWVFFAPVGQTRLDLKYDSLVLPWSTLVGTVTLLLAATACVLIFPRLWRLGWIQSRGRVFWCWFGLSALVLLSFGPLIRYHGAALAVGPYAMLYRFAPGFHGLRVPARIAVLFVPLLVMLACAGFERMLDVVRRRWWIMVAIGLLIALDLAVRPIPWQKLPVDSEIPYAFRWLRDHGDSGGVMVVPLDGMGRQPSPRYLYYAIHHGRPLLNGYPAFMPASCAYALRVGETFPSPESLVTLRQRGVRYVVLDLMELQIAQEPDEYEDLLAACRDCRELRAITLPDAESALLFEILPDADPNAAGGSGGATKRSDPL